MTGCLTGSGKVANSSANIFNVRHFGAKGDGTTFDTAAIQKALDACTNSGGTVEFPKGNYLSKPLTLHSGITVKLDARATLRASTNQNDFMKTPGDWTKAGDGFIPFIGGKDLTNVTFTGGGVIDGGGAAWGARLKRRVKSGPAALCPGQIWFRSTAAKMSASKTSPCKIRQSPTWCRRIAMTL